ncbi:MAG TPA: hypothetical protein VFC44_10505 [Candidatus Saccharimonadales bacterium]|nr:hypothetical protein [Candidatus Saccharimonadales bacterium]
MVISRRNRRASATLLLSALGKNGKFFFLRRLDGSVICALAAPGIVAASRHMAAGAYPYVTSTSNTFVLNSTTVALSASTTYQFGWK